jgi:hypothetical protein
MTLIELKEFAKWFARDSMRMVCEVAWIVFYLVFRLPIEIAQDHVKAFENDPPDGWAKLVVRAWVTYLIVALVTVIWFFMSDGPWKSAISTVSWVFGAVMAVYCLIVFMTYKVRQFRRERRRRERQHMLDALTSKPQ